MMSIKKEWMGLLFYSKWLRQQEEYLKESLERKKHWLLGLEHHPTITLGLSAEKDVKKNFLISEKKIREQNIEVIKVLRGGKAAFHSPGQLMIYPILNLRELKYSKLIYYIHFLLDTTIDFLDGYGIKGFKKQNKPGVFTKRGKIAFLGLRIHKGITSHGLAINISNDLSFFSMIRNCGLEQEAFDSMKNHFVFQKPQKLFDEWSNLFSIPFSSTRNCSGEFD